MKIGKKIIRLRSGTWILIPSILITIFSTFSVNALSEPETPSSLGKPANVTLEDTGYGIKVDWDASQENVNAYPERYAISWSTGESGWGVATGNVGDENALNTEITLDYSLFSSTGGLSAEYLVTVRADNDTYGIYSQSSDAVILRIGVSPVTPTTTTTTISPSGVSGGGCGPYYPMFITGATGNGGWGTGPFTDDSDFSRVAVFAGLVQPGETAWIEPYLVDNYSSYLGGSSNGVTMSAWGSNWCGYYVKLLGSDSPTTSTTTTVQTGTTSTTTTTILEDTTTTSSTTVPETTTTSEPEIVTSEPEITTTIVLPFPESTSSTIVETTTTEVPVVSTTTPVEEENVGVGVEPEPSVQETLPEPEKLLEDETSTQETAPELPLVDEKIEEVSTQSMSADEISETVIDILKEPLNDEEFVAALESIFNEPLSNEQFDAAITAVLDSELSDEQFSEVIGILESDSITVEQVESAVNNIIENGITEDQATELATSAKVLESITSDAAAEIFQEINVGALTDEQSAEIVAAVQNAPTEVKESFEEEINIFDGGFDDYVPVDSAVSVGERRTIVAVTVVSSVIAISAAAAPPAPSAPSGRGSSGGDPPSGGDNGGNKPRRRRGGTK